MLTALPVAEPASQRLPGSPLLWNGQIQVAARHLHLAPCADGGRATQQLAEPLTHELGSLQPDKLHIMRQCASPHDSYRKSRDCDCTNEYENSNKQADRLDRRPARSVISLCNKPAGRPSITSRVESFEPPDTAHPSGHSCVNFTLQRTSCCTPEPIPTTSCQVLEQRMV